MNEKQKVNDYLNAYCQLRDRQYAVYSRYAKKHNLTTTELFVLDILWFKKKGCTQKMICERLSMNKQTISSIISKFIKLGYLTFEEIESDRRNKRIIFTVEGMNFTSKIIPQAATADNLAMCSISLAKIEELVKLTELFTKNMEKEFESIMED